MAPSTITTLLMRLHDKGLVGYRKGLHGKAFLYSCRLNPLKIQQSLVKKLVSRFLVETS